jgi:hypothetical protein
MQKNRNKKTSGRTEMEEPTMTCNLCDESFNSEHELRDHQQTFHAAGVSSRRRSHESELDVDEEETAA